MRWQRRLRGERWVCVLACLTSACGSSEELARPDAGDVNFDASPADAGPAPTEDGGAPADAGVLPPLGSWSEGPPMPGGPRQETAVVAWGGEIVVIGGYDGEGRFGASVEAFDPRDGVWRDLPSLPAAMHHANAVVFRGSIWIVGFLGDRFEDDGRIFELAPGASGWQARGAMPPDRQRGASVVAAYEDAIYIVGGLSGRLPVAWVDRFEPATGAWRPLPPIPRAVDHAVGGVIGAELYVAGGRAGLISAHVPDLDVLDLITGAWTSGPAMPTSRGGAAGAVRGGVLYVIGGEGNAMNPPSRLFEAVEAFSPSSGAWTTLPPMITPRHGMGAATVDGRIYVPGGADVEAFGAVDTLEVLAP